MSQNNSASLVVVGTGIKSLSQLTTEARANIEQSDIVLYLVNEPVMKEWIVKANSRAESLDDMYFNNTKRIDSYREITNHILAMLHKQQHVCVVLYGHPTVYAKPALDAVLCAKEQGYEAAILPGISAEDCLYADLMIDPGSCGCVSYEATDLLIHGRYIDPAIHQIIWQISAIGAQGHIDQHDNSVGIKLLTEYLLDVYTPDHFVYVYMAAQYPGFAPYINKVQLKDLARQELPIVATLYIPPEKEAMVSQEMLAALKVK